MPSTDAEFTTRSGQKIRMLLKRGSTKPGENVDQRFMTADTCFWNVTLWPWSSLEVMRRQMKVVLSLSSGMDGDDVLEREVQSDFESQQRLRDREEAAWRGQPVPPVDDLADEGELIDEEDEEEEEGLHEESGSEGSESISRSKL